MSKRKSQVATLSSLSKQRSSTRKQERKKARKLRKFGKIAFASHKKVEDVIAQIYSKSPSKKKKRKKSQPKRSNEEGIGSVGSDSKRVVKEAKRKRQQREKIQEEDVVIKRFAKKLGYDKRKSRNVPAVFVAEGLDDLLEFCDRKRRSEILKNENAAAETGSDNGSRFTSDAEDSGKSDEEELEEEIKEPNSTEETLSNKDTEKEESEEGRTTHEDIYGREVDAKTGELLERNTAGAQRKLEELEEMMGVHSSEEKQKLERTMRGAINRLNEGTLISTVKTISDLFASHGRNEVKTLLSTGIMKSLCVPYRLPDRIILEYATLIALLHSAASTDITYSFVESFLLKYVELIDDPPENNTLENMSILLAELFNFKIIKGGVIIEVLQRLRDRLLDKTLSTSILILSYCGSLLRKRSLSQLTEYLTDTQTVLSSLPSDRMNDQHLRFLTEEYMEIKNANLQKQTSTVDSSIFDHYFGIYQGQTKKITRQDEIGFSLDDVLHIAQRGRWWVVGSAWKPPEKDVDDTRNQTLPRTKTVIFDQSLLDLAKKAHMNTDLRRSIFCTIMSSEDASQAFERLMRLSLKGQQERQIIHVCVICVLRESTYNPFYAVLIDHFCSFHKRFQLTTQYALWDRIRSINELSSKRCSHLAYLISDLILKRSISVTVLKVIEFGLIDAEMTSFVRMVLTRFISSASERLINEIFRSLAVSPQHRLFCDGLQLFAHTVLRKPHSNEELADTFMSKLKLLEQILGREDL
ncbi:hypothetical protein AB6A40_003749 [Gnathostoma spinigerum]|uniref:MI domain-containing protein n=1 Tax=Gnathostoma spinigerum TaxID=75299 RepID=A0ABD6EL89_9BILA